MKFILFIPPSQKLSPNCAIALSSTHLKSSRTHSPLTVRSPFLS
ncbi:hypothetical protein ACE1CD_36660 [Aerosakkonema sp. BLCC-F183]